MASTPWGPTKVGSSATVERTTGTTGSSTHSFTEGEKVAFVDWINDSLGKDQDLKHLLPVSTEGDALFKSVSDGILLCKLINDAVKDTVDERVINKGKGLSIFKATENQTLAVNSAKAIGCSTVNIGPKDLIEGTPHLVLGLIWQIVRIGLLSKINLKNHPELYRLLEPGETIEDLLKLPPDQILLRWFNYHLREAGHPRRVNNFSGDIKDSECYTVLLYQIAPKSKGVNKDALNTSDLDKRAQLVLDNADKLDCKKFLRPKDITTGNPKLNLAFVANLFNCWPALEPVEDVVIIEETREEKTYRNWMNSLGVDPFVGNLYEDLRDGLVLLQLFDKIKPGCVDWKKVNQRPFKQPGGNMKQLENCNYAINIAKEFKFSLVGIAGKDIHTANKTLTLAVVWQMMRAYVLAVLNALSKDGKPIGDDDIIHWANDRLRGAGKRSTVPNFKDKSLANAHAIVDLVDAISPGSVDYHIIRDGHNEEEQLNNAKYAISAGRKIGAVIFALPEDVVEVKHKMMLTIFAALMAVDLGAKV